LDAILFGSGLTSKRESVAPNSWLLGFGVGGAAEVFADGLTTVVADALAEAVAFFGGHAAEAAAHAAAEAEASGAMPPETAEENAAKREQAEGLPEVEHGPADKRGQKPVPEVLDDFTADEGEEEHSEECQWNDEKHFD
jgi:hypothetical protein